MSPFCPALAALLAASLLGDVLAQTPVQPPRRYPHRVEMHEANTPSPVPSKQSPIAEEGRLGTSARPNPLTGQSMPLPPTPAIPLREGLDEQEEDNWLLPARPPESSAFGLGQPPPQPSGWGWLADEVARRLSPAPGDPAPESEDQPAEDDRSGSSTNSPSRASVPSDSGLPLRGENSSGIDTTAPGLSLRFSPTIRPEPVTGLPHNAPPSPGEAPEGPDPSTPSEETRFADASPEAAGEVSPYEDPVSGWEQPKEAMDVLPRTEALLRQAMSSLPALGLGQSPGGPATPPVPSSLDTLRAESARPSTSAGDLATGLRVREESPAATGNAFTARAWESGSFNQPSLFQSRGYEATPRESFAPVPNASPPPSSAPTAAELGTERRPGSPALREPRNLDPLKAIRDPWSH